MRVAHLSWHLDAPVGITIKKGNGKFIQICYAESDPIEFDHLLI